MKRTNALQTFFLQEMQSMQSTSDLLHIRAPTICCASDIVKIIHQETRQ